jgi:hypothetical protein
MAHCRKPTAKIINVKVSKKTQSVPDLKIYSAKILDNVKRKQICPSEGKNHKDWILRSREENLAENLP